MRYAPGIRGVAWFVWSQLVPQDRRQRAETWIKSFGTVVTVLPESVACGAYVRRLRNLLQKYGRFVFTKNSGDLDAAAQFLFEQILVDAEMLTTSPMAVETLKHLNEHLPASERRKLHESISRNLTHPHAAWTLALYAVDGYLR